MPQGTIKKVVSDRGYGFIKGEEGEFFFHHSVLEDTTIESLHEGQQVEYTASQGPKGLRAESVKPVDGAGEA